MVAAAAGAPAVTTRIPFGAPRFRSSGAFASEISTVGAAHSEVIDSSFINRNACTGSTLRRHTCTAPTAVTSHVYVQPLAWNIGSVHRYRSAGVIGRWISVPTTFM